MNSNTLKIAVWKPSNILLHNIKKLDFSNEIIGIFDNGVVGVEYGTDYTLFKEEEIQNHIYDFILISFENHKMTKKYLNETFGVPLNTIFTFEEYWVKDCENYIVNRYHDRWEKIRLAHVGTFENKNVVIFGGASGIGKESAHCFLANGAHVVIVGRNIKKLQNVCAEYSRLGNIKYIQWDINEIANYTEKFSELKNLIDGQIDVLVNSAGVWDSNCADFLSVNVSEFDNVINTNLKANYFLCQIFTKYFIENKVKGHIVNVASNVGVLPTVKPYGLSKWGIIGLTKGLGYHLAEYGIIVNGVAPGGVATPLANWKEGDCPARRSSRNGRVSFACEVAELIVYLAGYTGENFVGEVLVCDGGDKTINMRL